MTAAAALWPATGRLETWAAFPTDPDLRTRGEADAVGGLYEQMHDRGELLVFDGRVTPVAPFLRYVSNKLAGERVIVAGADRYRRAEGLQALTDAQVRWPMRWRGTGAHAKADGSHDVRAFQRRALSGRLLSRDSLLVASALSESDVRYDDGGNPALCKQRMRSRIDVLQAAVIAAGLAEVTGRQPRGGLHVVR